MTDDRGQRSDDRGQRSEVREQKTEDRSQRAEIGIRKGEGGLRPVEAIGAYAPEGRWTRRRPIKRDYGDYGAAKKGKLEFGKRNCAIADTGNLGFGISDNP